MTVHHERRSFRVVQPFDRDAHVMVLVEHHWDTDELGVMVRDSAFSQVLTEQGWERFNAYDVLPMDRMPCISGLDVSTDRNVDKTLKVFEERLRETLETSD